MIIDPSFGLFSMIVKYCIVGVHGGWVVGEECPGRDWGDNHPADGVVHRFYGRNNLKPSGWEGGGGQIKLQE